MTRLRDETGMVGKIIIVWLLLVGLLGVVGLDAASIVFTKFRLNDTASTAATTAATSYQNSHDQSAACSAARSSIENEDPDAQIPKTFCKIDPTSGEATIVVRKQAKTILAGRLSFTEDLAKVSDKETAGPATL
jgi:uncharacterized membrane protein